MYHTLATKIPFLSRGVSLVKGWTVVSGEPLLRVGFLLSDAALCLMWSGPCERRAATTIGLYNVWMCHSLCGVLHLGRTIASFSIPALSRPAPSPWHPCHATPCPPPSLAWLVTCPLCWDSWPPTDVFGHTQETPPHIVRIAALWPSWTTAHPYCFHSLKSWRGY